MRGQVTSESDGTLILTIPDEYGWQIYVVGMIALALMIWNQYRKKEQV